MTGIQLRAWKFAVGIAVSAIALAGCINPGTYSVTPTVQNGTIGVGLWHTLGGDGCYWERLRGFSGGLDDIIANDFSNGGPRWVEVKSGDVGFHTSGCITWWQEPGPWALAVVKPGQPFGQGDFRVGYEVSAGTYSAPGGSGCYWERLSGFGGELADIIDNDFSAGGQQIVTINAGDFGFSSDGCGTWTLLGPPTTTSPTSPPTTEPPPPTVG